MERENIELRKALKNQQLQQGPASSHVRQPLTSQPSPPTARTEATRLPTTGERKRVARHPTANQRGRGEGGGGSFGKAKDVGLGTNSEGGGQRAVDRGVADDIIRRRQEDEQSNVMTEKYSRLRIK